MNHLQRTLTALTVIAFMSGCSSTGTKNVALMESEVVEATPVIETPLQTTDAGAETFSSDGTSFIDGNALAEAKAAEETAPFPSSNTVYYEFDSSQIGGSFATVIEEHAAYLNSHPNARISIEGHADERGTREYNMGLGEKRAQAVLQFLSLQGVAAKQLDMVSYGEEKPVAFGHNETSWRLNRRAEFIYTRR